MKTCYAAAGLVAAARLAGAQTLTAQERISQFGPEDFTTTIGGPEASGPFTDRGVQLRGVSLRSLPALEGQGLTMVLVNFEPCAILLPHLHPRATEMAYVLEGELRMAFVEENGGEGAVVNDVAQGDVMFFPQGLIHYQQNLGCEPAAFLAALNNEDAGAVIVLTSFFDLPEEALQATLNIEGDPLEQLLVALPDLPGQARLQCLRTCGLIDEDDDASMSFDFS